MRRLEIVKISLGVSVQADLNLAVGPKMAAALRIVERLTSEGKYDRHCDWVVIERE